MIQDLVQRIQEESDQIKRAKGLAEKRWMNFESFVTWLGRFTPSI